MIIFEKQIVQLINKIKYLGSSEKPTFPLSVKVLSQKVITYYIF